MSPKVSLSDILATNNKLFLNKQVVKPNYTLLGLEDILHRDEEIRIYFEYLKDIFNGVSPSNIFVYGKPGLGKTILTQRIFDEIKREAENRSIDLLVININCDEIRTEHAILQKIIQELPTPKNEPKKTLGNSKDKHNNYFRELVDKYPGIIVIVLDELDKAVAPEMINRIIRAQSKASGQFPAVIGITNDLGLKDKFPPHLKSVLCENSLIIKPYNAEQLADIIRARVKIAFRPNVVPDVVIQLCAAYAAHEYGDVRRSIDLLRVSGETAEVKNHSEIQEQDVREARSKLEIDKIVEVVKTLPIQSKISLLACIYVFDSTWDNTTVNIYEIYKQIAYEVGIDVLTQRRVTDLLSELDQLGIVEGINIFQGRYGRKKVITKIVSKKLALETLYTDFSLKQLENLPSNRFFVR